jgi:hypothetical protein
MDGFSFPDLCRILGKDAFTIKGLQRHLELHMPEKGGVYTQSYAIFMEKIVALRAFNVPQEDIKALFETEKKILRLLHVDTLTDSPTWYLDACVSAEDCEGAADRLLLTGHRLDFPAGAPAVQHNLDFGRRDPELFKGVEMGEDIRRVFRKYLTLLDALTERIRKERPVLRNALDWAERFVTRAAAE